MGKNLLVEALRMNNPKSNRFNCSTDVLSYKTGFTVFDYYLGYLVNVFNEKNELITQYPSIGITGGCYVCFIGRPSTGKTTMAVQVAANMVRKFDNGSVIHYDLEKAMNYSRIANLTKFKMMDMKDGKYILKKDNNSINDIKSAIMQLYMEKTTNQERYTYKTGVLNEFGEEIIAYEPTVVIIDSIPMLSSEVNINNSKEAAKLEEVSSQTERMRLTAEIGRFYSELTPYISEANITVISINQIKTNPGMGIVKSPSEILYLKQDEALPGGKAPQFLANILCKFVAIGSEKYTYEDDGVDGFGVRLEIIKSRTNQAGQSVNMVYDKIRGMDNIRSNFEYAKELGMIGGNKNGYYFTDRKDVKFTRVGMTTEFRANPELYKLMYEHIIPPLKSRLSALRVEEMDIPDAEFDY